MAAPKESGLHVAVLGCGFMGTAILQGLLDKEPTDSVRQYTACVRSESSAQRLRADLSKYKIPTNIRTLDIFTTAAEAADLLSGADVVILGCVPGDLHALLNMAGLRKLLRDKLVISLLAGISTSDLAEQLRGLGLPNSSGRIARVIPTLGAQIGDSVTLLAHPASKGLTEAHEKTVIDMFERIGSVVEVPEQAMDDATAIGAVCHALNIKALDAITDASVSMGMHRDVAFKLAAESLRSSSNLFCAGGMTPESLKTAMSTPQGITINSIITLQDAQVPAGIASSVRSAIEYARKM